MAGRNVAIEYRFSEGRDERLPQIAADLVGQSVSMLVADRSTLGDGGKSGDRDSCQIVFTSGLDPVQIGLVATSIGRVEMLPAWPCCQLNCGPNAGGSYTKLLLKPGTIAFVVNPNNAATPFQVSLSISKL